jgi:hypothetical protein
MALFVALTPAQSQCCLQCIVINCVIILVVLLSVPLSPYQVSSWLWHGHHHCRWPVLMCQPLCRFRPWECTAIRHGLIPVPGVVIALYGIVLVIYISRHICQLSCCLGRACWFRPCPTRSLCWWPSSFRHHLVPGIMSISSVVDTRPCVTLPDVIRAMDAPSLLLLAAHCPQWLLHVASLFPAAPVREVLVPLWCKQH